MNKLILVGLLILFSGCSILSRGNIYNVKSISSHYLSVNENSQTSITVWLNGKSGHVKGVLCAFPPDINLTGNNTSGRTGINKVRVGKKYQEFYFGQVSYLCSVIE